MVEVLALLLLFVSIGVVVEVYRARTVTQKLLSAIESHVREGLTWRTEHHAKVTELLSRIIEVTDRSTLPAPPPVMSASVRPAPMSSAVAPTARQPLRPPPMPVDDPADSGRLPFEPEKEDSRSPLLPLDRLLSESTRSEE